MLSSLVTRFGRADLWIRRQMFAQICSYILNYGDRCLSMNEFNNELLPCLLHLASDRVPNVRLMVAKTLYTQVANNCKSIIQLTFISFYETHIFYIYSVYFVAILMDVQNPQHDTLIETLTRLRRDEDRDVRYFADGNRGFGISAN